MRVFREIPHLVNTVLTVGTFDGVHRGHQALLSAVVERARSTGMESVVVTFTPHPQRFFGSNDNFFELTTLDEKCSLLDDLGIDNVVVMPFTTELATMPQEQFIKTALVDKLGMKHFVVGYDNRFGHDRKGSATTAREIGEKMSFTVEQIAPIDGISSTKIRDAIRSGDVERAGKMLGRKI